MICMGTEMRLTGIRRRVSSALGIVAACVGVYVVLAVTFSWLIAPNISKNHAVEAYEAAPVTFGMHSDAVSVNPKARSRPAAPGLLKPPASTSDHADAEPASAQSSLSSERRTATTHPLPRQTSRRSGCVPFYDSSGAQIRPCGVSR